MTDVSAMMSVLKPTVAEIVCNHYKFKSEEEYKARTKKLNTAGHMAGKFVHPAMELWMRDANVAPRSDILIYAEALRERLSRPLEMNVKAIPFYLAVVCMFRAEENYMEEWLQFHIIHGVEHFFLYCNDPELWRYEFLNLYIKSGYVTIIDWPNAVLRTIPEDERRTRWMEYDKKSTQNLAFIHWCRTYKKSTIWIAKIDVDEYIFPVDGRLLGDYLRQQAMAKGIEVQRLDFGSNGHVTKPTGLILERYTRSQVAPRAVKSIARTDYLADVQSGHAHYFDYI